MEHYTTHIKSKTGWFDIDVKELYQYRDLIWLFFKRNYSTKYKQTILGPLWLILSPVITVTLYSLVFGGLGKLSTDGVPHFVFYLCSNAIWTFFATSLTQTSNTFTANAAIMGKVYFPRLVMPISSVLTGMLDLVIQLAILIVVMAGYAVTGYRFAIGPTLLLAPVLILQTGILGLGFGIIVASLTTKYRDLAVLVGFGVSLWMYATPIVYPLSTLADGWMRTLIQINPVTPSVELLRYAILGQGSCNPGFYALSWGITLAVALLGIMVFNKVERTFMDTV